MTITRRAELENIGFDVGINPVKQGRIELRYKKLTYDGDRLVASDYHRTVVDVDTDMDGTLEALAQDLEGQGFARPPATDRAFVDAVSSLAWTQEVKAAVAADRERRRAELEAELGREQAEREASTQAEQERLDAAAEKAIDRLSRDGKNKA